MNAAITVNPDEFKIVKAVRDEEFGLFAIAAPTGGGKTKSALELATGLVKGTKKRIGMVDTENGRGKHYADEYDFDRIDLVAPYTPERYLAAILKFEKEGYGCCIVDSMSHEWNGEGGLEDIQNDVITRMCTKEDGTLDSAKAERLTALGWKEPKRRHKKMMSRLLQRKMHIIFCFRAEQKVKFKGGKVEDAGFLPICEKGFMFEMTLSCMMYPKEAGGTPGVPVFLKIEGQHQMAFEANKPMDVEAGRLMAAWCRGESIDGTKPVTKTDGKIDKKIAAPTQPIEPKEQTPPPEPDKKADTGKVVGDGAFAIVTSSKGDTQRTGDVEIWRNGMLSHIQGASAAKLDAFLKFNKENITAVLEAGHGLAYRDIEKAIEKRRKELA